MSNKVKAIVAAILILLSSLFGGYVALTDSDDTTNPDVKAIAEDAKDVFDAVTAKDEAAAKTEAAPELAE